MPNESGVPTLADLFKQGDALAETLNKQGAADRNFEKAKKYKEQLEAGGKGKSYNIKVGTDGDVSFGENQHDETAALLKAMQIKNLEDERNDRAVSELEKRSTGIGTPQAISSLRRVEGSVPGISSGQAKFKSVGGIKNLAPNIAVPMLEKLGLMDQGAGDERAALQELSNTKIYDSSGKTINESEAQRLKDSMGLRGIFEPDTINQAAKQIGDTIFQKQQNVTAGARPAATNTFKGRGGLAGFSSLQEMLGKPAQQAAAPQPQPAMPAAAPAPAPQAPQAATMTFEQFKAAKKAGQIR